MSEMRTPPRTSLDTSIVGTAPLGQVHLSGDELAAAAGISPAMLAHLVHLGLVEPTAPGTGGAPTIADFDGHGRREFATAGGTFYTVFDLDCAGLGDASLANLPPEAGLYACLFGGLVFWLFCSSRHTTITVTSAISLRLRRMLRLHGDLEVDLEAAAIIVDLLERLEWLEAELARLRRLR